MFTGLVQDVGAVTRLHPGGMLDLWIHTALGARDFARGESIAVDGACLTVVETRGDEFLVQASEETLRRTTLGRAAAGTPVNLERAMRLGDRLGGHLVLGHVDAVGEVRSRGAEGDALVLAFSLPGPLAPFFIEKGSVTVDGVSLTVNALGEDHFTVALIPETQARTTLGKKQPGDRVNLEADLIGKYVARLHGLRQSAGQAPGGLTAEALAAAGFGRRE
ncbi:MAG TPA: riboflavin synthase [Myxococcaceae bacterium]|nr:riboflavin synthase [Myxococcaceae bacterium]